MNSRYAFFVATALASAATFAQTYPAKPVKLLVGFAADEAGALRALEILRDELVRTMQLCGVRSVAEVDPELVWLP